MGFFDKITTAVRGEAAVPVYTPSKTTHQYRPRMTSPPTTPESAMSLDQVSRATPGVLNLYKSAGLSLTKRNLLGERAATYLVLDRSGSMDGMYHSGVVQRFAEKVLALSAHFDDDGVVPTFAFGSRVYGPVEMDVLHSEGAVSSMMKHVPSMPATHYAPMIDAIVDFHLSEVESKSSSSDEPAAPGLVIFQTDGQAGDPKETIEAIRRASHLPIFFQFVGFGGSGPESFGLLNELDDLDGRLIDNAGFFWAGHKPDSLSDAQVFDGLMNEFPEYLDKARHAFTSSPA